MQDAVLELCKQLRNYVFNQARLCPMNPKCFILTTSAFNIHFIAKLMKVARAASRVNYSSQRFYMLWPK